MPPFTGKHTQQRVESAPTLHWLFSIYSQEPSLQRNSVPFKVCS